MILVLLLKTAGWITAALPERMAEALCGIAGFIVYYLPSRRRHILLSNLHHAFPEKTERRRRQIARKSCGRMVEMGLYLLASPYLKGKRLQSVLTLPEKTMKTLDELAAENRGGIALIPHFCLMETFLLFPRLYPELPPLGAVFRPLDNGPLDDWIKRTRERFGLVLLSRKEGFNHAFEIIRRSGWVGVLFDQNAGERGALITFLGRVASATVLPELMARKFKVPAIIAFPRRTGFWRAQLFIHRLDREPDTAGLTLASNQWLEKYLLSDEKGSSDWLWMHRRWHTQIAPRRRLRLQQKKNYLEADRKLREGKELPRKTRLWVRLPNWLGDAIMTIPLLRAIRKGRPDAELTLLVRKSIGPFFSGLELADEIITLPAKKNSWSYFRFFRNLKRKYPDTYLLFTNSQRGDLEAWLSGCPQRFGMRRPGKARPLLTHAWTLPPDLEEDAVHQTRVWEKYLRHFGLVEELDFSPLPPSRSEGGKEPRIGLICGTENMPEKRWPAANWRKLVEYLLAEYPNCHLLLFGTERDRPATQAVGEGFPDRKIHDHAGKTDLPAFLDQLSGCRLAISNDTGGMHLANACGVPLIGLFGPTNPVRTGPVFQAPIKLLLPRGSPPTGGFPIAKISPEMVQEAIKELL